MTRCQQLDKLATLALQFVQRDADEKQRYYSVILDATTVGNLDVADEAGAHDHLHVILARFGADVSIPLGVSLEAKVGGGR